MGRGRRLLTRRGPILAVALAGWAIPAVGQTSTPTSQAAEWELPADARAALAQTRDFVFHFDQPGFYAVLDYVKHSPHSPGTRQPPSEVTDWRDLLERPSDFRGRPVTVTGRVGRNKDPYLLESHPELGLVSQIELERPDQPLACTLILTGSASDIPLGSTITVTGYFVMVRNYYGPSKRVQQAALIVAAGPTMIDRAVPRTAGSALPDWRWIAAAIVVGLVITLWLLWRAGASTRRDYRGLRARQEAPTSLADDLAQWSEHEHRDDP
jgi:hypothetical protein